MKTLYTFNKAAGLLGVTYQELNRLVRKYRLTTIGQSDFYGNYHVYIPKSEIDRLVELVDSNDIPGYTNRAKRKVIKIETYLEIPDEWYDEDYQRIYNRARDMYEHQRIDDLY